MSEEVIITAQEPELYFMGRKTLTGSANECVGILAQIVEEQQRRIEELEAMVWPCGK